MGLSIYKAGKYVGVSGNYISLIERGKYLPSKSLIIALSELYNIEPLELMLHYNKLETHGLKETLLNPHMRKILLEFAHKKNVTPEEKESLSKELCDVAMQILNKYK